MYDGESRQLAEKVSGLSTAMSDVLSLSFCQQGQRVRTRGQASEKHSVASNLDAISKSSDYGKDKAWPCTETRTVNSLHTKLTQFVERHCHS